MFDFIIVKNMNFLINWKKSVVLYKGVCVLLIKINFFGRSKYINLYFNIFNFFKMFFV